MRTRLWRATARFLLAALFFAQGALAFAGCEMPRRAPALAFVAAEQPCHDSGVEANLCLAHCLAEDQSSDKPSPAVKALTPAPVLALRLTLEPQKDAALAPLRLALPPPAAAPLRILYLHFLI